jgi:hypothetical protein
MYGEVAPIVRRAEKRQRVERGSVRIVRIGAMELRHRIRVREVAGLLVGVAVEDLDGTDVRLFPRCSAAGEARLARRRQPRQGFARGAAVLLHPHRMVVGHRLAPIGHREAGIDLLRPAKEFGSSGVLEIVKLGKTGEETLLRGGRAGILERHRTEGGLPRERQRRRQQDHAS